MKAILFPLALAGLCLTPATVQAAPEAQTISVQEWSAAENYLLESNIAVYKAAADYMEQNGYDCFIALRLDAEFAKTYPLHTLPAEHQAFLREYYGALEACLEEAAGIENQDVAMEALNEKLYEVDGILAKKYPRAHRELGIEGRQSFDAKCRIPEKLTGFLEEHPELNTEEYTQLVICTLRFMAEEFEKLRK